jgi:alpha-glucosidase
MLALYRAGLRLRKTAPWSAEGELRWVPVPAHALAFERGDSFACFVNFGPAPLELPAGADVLIASNELEGGALPQDTAVWLRRPAERNG